MNSHPLRIGISTRLMHQVPAELGFRGKTLQYLEQSFAHWIMAHGALALMVPTLGHDAEVARRRVHLDGYVDLLDGLMLQIEPSTPEELRERIARESRTWEQFIRDHNLGPQ